ncbi:MAG: sulfur carrier protein ThiS adenylyltransferase ThiF [Pseudodesulfovibrio sp.]|uniref:Thiamine biosynthesis protein ThiF n=2 Tax=Desulfovibrionaceae TaxID=194924 RepID=E6VUP2_PSEA9|nr:thiamine biosynthesis protein ThiF [Pseudodesulfovibrio aespoeensis Aspo-2]MBU4193302.1 sulfur carrier protein ThiS adenylyltransferase ThiF [Pseudomonadota bacterium]MBV1764533.1 sulfur carrier protein ThiS adenylyltransferase ThiF [Pseudodesulfovibrio sp.]MBU4243333.1 sulfur carrier protein ThiS adenylyltransferase ThiF [Pseudomonadota bacterium]MBU4380499.1 sulfur carrier protein ThiS adenylyltransferase ThiF [Pseudomonadota bacterium]
MNAAEQGIAVHLGAARLRHLQSVTVGIAGVGGLGSNCAMLLARSGFKRFVLVDFDCVDGSNLNRQTYGADQIGQLKVTALSHNLLAVNPDLCIDPRTVRVTPESMEAVFAGCDAVVEAFDDPQCKRALVEALVPTGVLVVAASGIGGHGNADAIVTRRVRDNFIMIGDMETECSAEHPPLAPRVALAAAKQADAVLSHFLNIFNGQGGA